ncbi:hypothetical protein COT78_02715 [Candidatus Berkelbacteria bacterium CG10_big_fil_rev_8_21_14_0_10_43_13]|uniref:phosphoglycerate mutase (2,3-diphosphoglycerate-independent) n=1 Tax=Candidatus Berkelbacteria bacterium CG10_big_fil_rev_8_21_14_0_10_43_13 TaxID=1974514 RepID=A0A2H0W677_9BACT|nr:MAG: hypothetical protein COT78_02715 [Candidatus Berkelbacteria bacterium CG10_big_fil_rev_8_21_14_0_10_43_13]
MTQKEKKPIVLIIADGFGLSTSWQGNAITAAQTAIFSEYWQDYRHLVLQSKRGVYDDCYTGYTEIATGQPNKSRVRLTQESLSHNQRFLSSLDAAKRNNASIQILAQVSNYNLDEIVENLSEIARFAKRNSIIGLFVHLFFDSSVSTKADAAVCLSAIEDCLKIIEYGQIASLSGCGNKKKHNTALIVKMLLSGKAQTALSAKQALALQKSETPAEMSPTIIKLRHNPKISSFDLPFLLSVPSPQLTDVLREIIMSANEKTSRAVSFLDFWAISEFPFDLRTKVNYFFQKDLQSYLSNILYEQGLHQALVTDQDNLHNLDTYYLDGLGHVKIKVPLVRSESHLKKQTSTTEEITDLALQVIAQKQCDFITVNFPSLYRFSQAGLFAECVTEVKLLDKSLGRIVKDALAASGYVVFCSAFGGAEGGADTKIEQVNEKQRQSHLPFIIISAETKHKSGETLLQEIVHSKADLTNVFDALKILLSGD